MKMTFTLFGILVVLLCAGPLMAADIYVDASVTGGANDGSSWADAFTSLQSALASAGSGDTVHVAEGTYTITNLTSFPLQSGVALLGGYPAGGGERDPATHETILRGHGSGSYGSVVDASNTDSSTLLDGFTISDGTGDNGGGVYAMGGSPTLRNLIFRNNLAYSNGGALYADSPELTNVTFSDNSTEDGDGGAMWAANPTLTDVTFTNNDAQSGYGGGLFSHSATLTNVTFSGNQANAGGGGACMENGTLTNVTFTGNSAIHGDGLQVQYGSATFTNVTFSGDIPDVLDAVVEIRNTILWGVAPAIEVYDNGNASVTVSDSVVQGGWTGGTNIITVDPKLGTLGDNGGYTQTIPLLEGSSAIDTANAAYAPDTDQRGYVRPAGGGYDIGAYEYGVGTPGSNTPPTAKDDAYNTSEDTALDVTAPGVLDNDSDADGDSLSAVVVNGPSNGSLTLNADGSFTYTPDQDGTDSFTYKAYDGKGGSSVATVTITVSAANHPPVATNDTASTIEDTPVTIDVLTNDTDADGDPLTAVLVTSPSHGSLTQNADGSFTYTPNSNFSGTDSFTYKANDGTSDSAAATVTITVTSVNNPPQIGIIMTDPIDPVPVGTTIDAAAIFQDEDPDNCTGTWDWGDAITSEGSYMGKIEGYPTFGGSHPYSAAGVYTVGLNLTDATGEPDAAEYQYVVIYDPSGGFVTGGGWIWSPIGPYEYMDVEGKATFGFVSKYKKGATVPSGNTEFQFKAGDLNFHSSSYDWLVVNQAGSNAQFKGSGTINDSGDYKFMLWAGDGASDTFRIRIWIEDEAGTEEVVYDNGFDQAISGGSIVVHKK